MGNQMGQIIIDHLSCIYDADTNHPHKAIDDISLVIHENEFIGLIGHTGSGKSSLIQHLNALITPTSGTIYFDGEDIHEKGYSKTQLRSKVGLVFQYPEHQLFEETVYKDVCFGPRNLGLSEGEIELRAVEALHMVGLPNDFYYDSPLHLSGGQKRRVAIAGVLAMRPDVLILDEPTAGLDPMGRNDILELIKKMHDETNMTIILVSHSMEDVANYVSRIIAMDHGKIAFDGSPVEVFRHYKELEEIGLAAPQVTYIMHNLKERGHLVNTDIISINEAADEIARIMCSIDKSQSQ